MLNAEPGQSRREQRKKLRAGFLIALTAAAWMRVCTEARSDERNMLALENGAAASDHDRRLIARVMRAGSSEDASRLMFAYPSGRLVLYYGNPRHRDGIVPTGDEATMCGPTAVGRCIESYHVLGGACDEYYDPSTGTTGPMPNLGECRDWRPSAADRMIDENRSGSEQD